MGDQQQTDKKRTVTKDPTAPLRDKKRKVTKDPSAPLPPNWIAVGGMYQKLKMMSGIHFRKRSPGGEHEGDPVSGRPTKACVYPQKVASWVPCHADFHLFNNQLHLQLLLHLARMWFNDCCVEQDFDPETFVNPSDDEVEKVLAEARGLGITVHPGTFKGESFTHRVPPQVPINSTTRTHFDTQPYKTSVKSVKRFIAGKGFFGESSSVVEQGRAAVLAIINFDMKEAAGEGGGVEDGDGGIGCGGAGVVAVPEGGGGGGAEGGAKGGANGGAKYGAKGGTKRGGGGGAVAARRVLLCSGPGPDLLEPVQTLIDLAGTVLAKPLNFQAGDLVASHEHLKHLAAAVKKLEVVAGGPASSSSGSESSTASGVADDLGTKSTGLLKQDVSLHEARASKGLHDRRLQQRMALAVMDTSQCTELLLDEFIGMLMGKVPELTRGTDAPACKQQTAQAIANIVVVEAAQWPVISGKMAKFTKMHAASLSSSSSATLLSSSSSSSGVLGVSNQEKCRRRTLFSTYPGMRYWWYLEDSEPCGILGSNTPTEIHI